VRGALRIDKYLKVSRLAKRRSEAHEALVNGRITREGKVLKPGYDVKVGDVLELHYARKFLTVRILVVPERVTPGLRDVALYEVLAERRDEPADWLSS
jgi:ribosomal 50S subunit-recycling heat shock protein